MHTSQGLPVLRQTCQQQIYFQSAWWSQFGIYVYIYIYIYIYNCIIILNICPKRWVYAHSTVDNHIETQPVYDCIYTQLKARIQRSLRWPLTSLTWRCSLICHIWHHTPAWTMRSHPRQNHMLMLWWMKVMPCVILVSGECKLYFYC